MTATTAPNTLPWLAKELTSLGPFVVRLNGGTIGGAFAPGHWVVVMDAVMRLRPEDLSAALARDGVSLIQDATYVQEMIRRLPVALQKGECLGGKVWDCMDRSHVQSSQGLSKGERRMQILLRRAGDETIRVGRMGSISHPYPHHAYLLEAASEVEQACRVLRCS